MLTLDNKICKAQGSIESELDGEVVLMNIENNEYYSLDFVGSEIWKLISEPVKISDLIEKLQTEFKVEKAICEKDTLVFLNNLLEKNIIEFQA